MSSFGFYDLLIGIHSTTASSISHIRFVFAYSLDFLLSLY